MELIARLPAALRRRLGLTCAVYVALWIGAIKLLCVAVGPEMPLTTAVSIVLAVWLSSILFAAGLLLVYNVAVIGYRHKVAAPPAIAVEHAPTPTNAPPEHGSLNRYTRIGIVLAGGGAKGAYQAGAMRAIHEFLERRNALDRVAMIAGTSIGAWNAMFWLSGMIKSPNGALSAHEQWWRSISLERIVEFDTYRPLKLSLFRTTPWEETFMRLFRDTDESRKRIATLFSESPQAARRPHVYFTRTNVGKGTLEFSTNRPRNSLATLRRSTIAGGGPLVSPDTFDVIEGPNAFDRLRGAVFASMDLPPLFPYSTIATQAGQVYEDGGVVANLPIWFGTDIEECDLLFVLPLNASFTAPPPKRSMHSRLLRVLDIRQGLLEREAIRAIYHYNEAITLRNRIARSEGRSEMNGVSVFAVCPEPPLQIDTTEFWAGSAASVAFSTMYKATNALLESKFNELTTASPITMACVSSLGETTLREII